MRANTTSKFEKPRDDHTMGFEELDPGGTAQVGQSQELNVKKRTRTEEPEEEGMVVQVEEAPVTPPTTGWSCWLELDEGQAAVADVFFAERPDTDEGRDQGSHLTAWVVLCDALRAAIKGKGRAAASAAVAGLLAAIGRMDPTLAGEAAVAAKPLTPAASWGAVRTGASQYLQLRNRVAGTATTATATRDGAGEGVARGRLLASDSITPDAFGTAAVALFDEHAFDLVLSTKGAAAPAAAGRMLGLHLAELHAAYGARLTDGPAAVGTAFQLVMEASEARLAEAPGLFSTLPPPEEAAKTLAQATVAAFHARSPLEQKVSEAMYVGYAKRAFTVMNRPGASVSYADFLKALKVTAELQSLVERVEMVCGFNPGQVPILGNQYQLARRTLTEKQLEKLKKGTAAKHVASLDRRLKVPELATVPVPTSGALKAQRSAGPVGCYTILSLSSETGNIDDVDTFGRPDGAHTEGMGRHTTAWVVLCDAIAQEINGESLEGANEHVIGEWNKTAEQAKAWPASTRKTQITTLWAGLKGGAEQLVVEKRVSLLLALWNIDPMASHFTGKGDAPGGGEGSLRDKLYHEGSRKEGETTVSLAVKMLDAKSAIANAEAESKATPKEADAVVSLYAKERDKEPEGRQGLMKTRLDAIIDRHIDLVIRAYFEGDGAEEDNLYDAICNALVDFRFGSQTSSSKKQKTKKKSTEK